MYRIRMSDGSVIRTKEIPSIEGNDFIWVDSEASGTKVIVNTRQIITLEFVR